VVDAVLFGIPLLGAAAGSYRTAGLVVMALALVPAVLGLSARGAEPAAVP
jgi:hypothetical protein